MKKIFALFLALSMTMGLAACGGSSSAPAASSGAAASAPAASSAPVESSAASVEGKTVAFIPKLTGKELFVLDI